MDKQKTIYDLELHEAITVKSKDGHPTEWRITRVAGGWLYVDDNPRRTTVLSFFVPYHNEFQIAEQNDIDDDDDY